jgi:hypothetical protein
MLKINTGRFDSPALNWSEAAGWDAEADFYKAHARKPRRQISGRFFFRPA